jgi:hypothetical protein
MAKFIPPEAGIQEGNEKGWVPAFAGTSGIQFTRR